MTKVSVVVPTCDRLAQLRRVIAALERQTFPRDRYEVIVVSDGSTDGTEDYLRSLNPAFPFRPVLQSGNRGPSASRNRGVASATGELVVFLDDDMVPAPELVQEHTRIHEEHGPGVVVIGPMLAPPGFRASPWVHWEQETLRKQYDAMILGRWKPTARQFYTGNASLERHHFQESGGFDENLRRSEDVDLAYRLAARGLRFVFAPHAIAHHYAHRSYRDWSLIPYTYGRNDVTLAGKGHPRLLQAISQEFRTRHFLTRWLVGACLDRQWLREPAISGLRHTAETAHRFHLSGISNLACGAIFNLRHYQGIADGLGGRRQFLAVDRVS